MSAPSRSGLRGTLAGAGALAVALFSALVYVVWPDTGDFVILTPGDRTASGLAVEALAPDAPRTAAAHAVRLGSSLLHVVGDPAPTIHERTVRVGSKDVPVHYAEVAFQVRTVFVDDHNCAAGQLRFDGATIDGPGFWLSPTTVRVDPTEQVALWPERRTELEASPSARQDR